MSVPFSNVSHPFHSGSRILATRLLRRDAQYRVQGCSVRSTNGCFERQGVVLSDTG